MNDQNMASGNEGPHRESSLLQEQLVLGSREGVDKTSKPSLANDAAQIFSISPEKAFSLLCLNLEGLGETNAGLSTNPLVAVASAFNRITGRDGVANGEESTPMKVTELHFDSPGQEGHDSVQQSVLSKRFLSKKEPPIPLKVYLERIHRYCPMSTAVYLATSIYITKMTKIEKVFSVNPKNMHRLVLAGLRVAMKALEDLSYPHSRVAKVGGVSERELSRLEISFCFLADFELRVDAQMLMDEAESLQSHSSS
ncbi:hypothetical protein ASPWEDRAFT_43746 [Aspergillus wentii DTO 134E9]|uniref:Cyclin-dependent protein kinase complex component n=1 Tax=Aspergillus wentii DTO 134E9 TaxID=1073089 RepID=A0A1L9RA66_ASPWE|nr:uncharacterized protein ASPWEDRAFT_43746 [Aspergillus wentii DTO 134E9]KAI9927356.1 hypothetical protein MW887_002968 [Aspergillus wentii]OJJ31763.1 hypothetical protein ASPWEDRAFT_43746 [Aspergillus wentii DTO 134E9]